MSGFSNPVVGSLGDLIRNQVQSPNFVANTTGWNIAQDGTAQFNDLNLLGNLTIESNDAGIFIYGYTPG